MASTTQDELYQSFLAVSGQQASAIGDATLMLADVVAQIGELRSSTPAPVAATTSRAPSTTAQDSGSTLGVSSTVLKAGLGWHQ